VLVVALVVVGGLVVVVKGGATLVQGVSIDTPAFWGKKYYIYEKGI